jgi:5-methylcytosine-specific restriction enzyme B
MLRPEYTVRGSAGVGNPATVPWIAVFPPGSEPSARSGYYITYLFAADGSAVYLTLNQAAEKLRDGGAALRKRALDLRSAVGADDTMLTEIDLASENALVRRYAAGNVYAYRYPRDQMPPECQLREDLAHVPSLHERARAAGVEFDP